jgi:chromosome segregation ATPase
MVARAAMGFSLFLLAACGAMESDTIDDSSKDDRIAELEAHVSDLEDQLQAAKDAASDLKTANDDLGSAAAEARDTAARFQHENWRDVVPDAEAAADRVVSAQSDVESASTALDDAIDE